MLRLLFVACVVLSCSRDTLGPIGPDKASMKYSILSEVPDWCNPHSIVIQGKWETSGFTGFSKRPRIVQVDRVSDCVYEWSIADLAGKQLAEDALSAGIEIAETDTLELSKGTMIVVSAEDTGDLVTMSVALLQEYYGWLGAEKEWIEKYEERILADDDRTPAEIQIWGDVMLWGRQYRRML